MGVGLSVVRCLTLHFVRQPVGKHPHIAVIQRVVQHPDHIRPCLAVVLDHLLLHVLRLGSALKEFHGLLQRDLRALYKAGEKDLLGHGAGHGSLVGIDRHIAVKRQGAEPFAGSNHFVRQHIPHRLSVCAVERQNDAVHLSALNQLRPEGADGNIQRQLEEYLLPGQILGLKTLQKHFLVHGHTDSPPLAASARQAPA